MRLPCVWDPWLRLTFQTKHRFCCCLCQKLFKLIDATGQIKSQYFNNSFKQIIWNNLSRPCLVNHESPKPAAHQENFVLSVRLYDQSKQKTWILPMLVVYQCASIKGLISSKSVDTCGVFNKNSIFVITFIWFYFGPGPFVTGL